MTARLNTKDTNPKDAIGSTKAPASTLSRIVAAEIALGMLEGACKYGRHNYRVAGVRASVYFDATMRHIAAWWEGQDIDPESGIHHLSKAMASLFVLRDAQIHGKVYDDRPPRAPENWMADIQKHVDAILARHPEPKQPFTQENQ